MKNKSKEINEQIEFGLDSLDPERKIEIKLKDLYPPDQVHIFLKFHSLCFYCKTTLPITARKYVLGRVDTTYLTSLQNIRLQRIVWTSARHRNLVNMPYSKFKAYCLF